MEFLDADVVEDLIRTKERLLGEGSYGNVYLVTYRDELAALKTSKCRQKKDKALEKYCSSFLKEAKILQALKGAGGAPVLHGIQDNPSAMLMSYKGSQNLLDILQGSTYNLLDVGIQIGRRRIIFMEGDPEDFPWCAPEILCWKPSTPATDVFSYGIYTATVSCCLMVTMEFLDADVVEDLIRTKERLLGEGSYGNVYLVTYRDELAALKTSKCRQKKDKALEKYCSSFLKEAKILQALKGAGGAPVLHGIQDNPSAMLMSYKGSQNLLDIYRIGKKLQEIHEAGYIHNDLKEDNIIIDGSAEEPQVSIIDYGLACPKGRIIFMEGDPEDFPWCAPEILCWKPSTPATDVFSYGYVMSLVLKALKSWPKGLDNVVSQAMDPNPKHRPSLRELLRRN
nr:uncharacterized protein LOC128705042 [Cherax quadricarinatus]